VKSPTVSQKRIPDIIDCKLKKDEQILIYFLVQIFLWQLAIKWPLGFPPHPASVFALTGKIRTVKFALKWTRNRQKTTISIIDCNLKRDYQILIIFGTNIWDTIGHQMTVQVLTSPNVCFCTTCEKWNKRNMCWNGQNVNKFNLSGRVAPEQSVDYKFARFDCHAAVSLPDDV